MIQPPLTVRSTGANGVWLEFLPALWVGVRCPHIAVNGGLIHRSLVGDAVALLVGIMAAGWLSVCGGFRLRSSLRRLRRLRLRFGGFLNDLPDTPVKGQSSRLPVVQALVGGAYEHALVADYVAVVIHQRMRGAWVLPLRNLGRILLDLLFGRYFRFF